MNLTVYHQIIHEEKDGFEKASDMLLAPLRGALNVRSVGIGTSDQRMNLSVISRIALGALALIATPFGLLLGALSETRHEALVELREIYYFQKIESQQQLPDQTYRFHQYCDDRKTITSPKRITSIDWWVSSGVCDVRFEAYFNSFTRTQYKKTVQAILEQTPAEALSEWDKDLIAHTVSVSSLLANKLERTLQEAIRLNPNSRFGAAYPQSTIIQRVRHSVDCIF